MKTCIESADRRFLERLHQLGDTTIQGICSEFGITATAVRHRLSRLQELGLVMRDVVRSGRGRPHHNYRVSEDGLRMLGENYADLALTLWRVLREIDEPELRASLLNRVEDAFVRRYSLGNAGTTMADRLEGLRAALVDRGYDVEVDWSAELPVLRENNCPYLELASHDNDICKLEQAVFRRVLGADVQLTQCCLDGHSCCEFQAVAAESPRAAALQQGS